MPGGVKAQPGAAVVWSDGHRTLPGSFSRGNVVQWNTGRSWSSLTGLQLCIRHQTETDYSIADLLPK